jgi:hypothetical protein
MYSFNEDELEKASLEWMEELGYEIIFAPVLPKENIRREKIIVMYY